MWYVIFIITILVVVFVYRKGRDEQVHSWGGETQEERNARWIKDAAMPTFPYEPR